MSVVFINLFDVPVGRDEEFLDLWQEVNTYMAGQPGYLDHRLHRVLEGDEQPARAPYRYINVATWESAPAWAGAHDAGFRALVSQASWADFSSRPGLFEVVRSGSR